MAGARELKKPESKRKGPVLAAAAVLVVAGAYLGLCAWVGGTGVMPNVTVAGLDVSGKDLLEIQPVVDQALQEHGGNAKVTLTYGGWSGSITGDQMDPFGENSALNAWEVGRGSFLTRGVQYVRHLMGGPTEAELDLFLEETEQPALDQLLDQAEQAIGCDVNQSGYEVVEDKLVMTKGKIVADGTPKEVFRDVEGMKKVGLTVPETTQLLWQLRQDGLDVPLDALSDEECAQALYDLLKK